jgi:hypothetical protein
MKDGGKVMRMEVGRLGRSPAYFWRGVKGVSKRENTIGEYKEEYEKKRKNKKKNEENQS